MERAPENVKTYEERIDDLTAAIFKDVEVVVIDETLPQKTVEPAESSSTAS
jgi:hypothetical protein